MSIRLLGPDDADVVLGASTLFDGPALAGATLRFLSEPTHHLFMAFDDAGSPIGFVSGVETTHPDKGTEMFLYELAVAEPAQRHGTGRALVTALRELARARGCYAMWVLTDDDNTAARRTYETAGAHEHSRALMYEWLLEPDEPQG